MVCRGSTFHEGSLLGFNILVIDQPVVLFTLFCAGMVLGIDRHLIISYIAE